MQSSDTADGLDDLALDLDDDPPIDLLNDSIFLDGMARIMAEARARGPVSDPRTMPHRQPTD